MKILKPFYYDDFKCVANKCKDSCCIGWNIDIDKKSYNKYKRVKGEFGKKIQSGICRNRSSTNELKYGNMDIKSNDGVCPFLNEENLCDVYVKLGEEYLCSTCKVYPRLIEKYGEIYERNISVSCPVVAEVLVKSSEYLEFLLDEESFNNMDKEYVNNNQSYNMKLYDVLWKSRSLSIEIAQYRPIKLWKRLMLIILTEEKIQHLINSSSYENINDVIFMLKQTMSDSKISDTLDNISTVPKVKILFTNIILDMDMAKNRLNNTFVGFINDFNEFIVNETNMANSSNNFNKDVQLLKQVAGCEKEFNEYLENKEYIIENYVVYNLYGNYMKSLYTKDLHKEIVRLVLSYSIINMILFGRWIKNNKKLKDEDFVDAIYSFSRMLEHNEQFINKIYNNIKNAGYDSMAYLAMLIR